MRKFKIALAVVLTFCLSGCQGAEADSGNLSERNSMVEEVSNTVEEPSETEPPAPEPEEVSNTVEESSETEPEETYMEKCNEILAEMPPEEILKKRDGILYPKFQKYTYYSQTAERDTPVNVLLPEGYSEDREYPVLYILHGYYDNQDWMAREIVHIPEMLTNLVSNGEAKEMIVVLPYIYCSKDMPYCTGMDTQNTLNYDNFINDMMTDLLPFIEENFSVAKGRENTAITGFSMGGRESLFIGISHPEAFGYIGAVCPAPGLTNGSGDPWQLEQSELMFDENAPYLLLISAAEHDGVVGNNPARYEKLFTRNNTEHLWHSMSSTGHDASSVTPHLYNFFRMIFQ